jgi:murein L,D-transpeptidase YcbB/YkuD
MLNKALRFGVLCALATAATACEDKYTPGEVDEVMGIQMAGLRAAIATRLDSGTAPSWVNKDRWSRVRGLYKTWGNAPLWLEEQGVRDRATALLKALEEAPLHGLSTEAYPIDSIRAVVNDEEMGRNTNARMLAGADVLLTAAYVAYASDMLMGQIDPKTVSQAWHIPMRVSEVDSALVRTLQSPVMAKGLGDMVPQDSSYAILKSEYARYREIVKAGGWSPITGTKAATPAAVAARLRAEGFEVDSTDVSSAVKMYQERHGLTETGRVDAGTLAAMNVPVADRLKQIETNLERARWMPRLLGSSRYILVNVPAFRLEAFNGGQKELEMKVVVGAEYEGRSTPVFSDSMEYVVFRPYWNVTPTIAAKEFFPKYGTTNLPAGYETWSENGQLRIRQRPGDKNSLGLVKFMFPNDFNIYLHDTPAKSLFKLADRAASHGCIRLEKPDALAQWALGWDAGRVQQMMHGSDNRTVKLPSKIPVYIVYFTAYARDGHLHFGDDIYDRDDVLEEKMDSLPVAPSAPPRRSAT